jgi:hypothetical protein
MDTAFAAQCIVLVGGIMIIIILAIIINMPMPVN